MMFYDDSQRNVKFFHWTRISVQQMQEPMDYCVGINQFPVTIPPRDPQVLSTKLWENKWLSSHPGSYFLSTSVQEKEIYIQPSAISSWVTGSKASSGRKSPDEPMGKDLPPSVRSCPISTCQITPPGLAFSSLTLPKESYCHPSGERDTKETQEESHFTACSWLPRKLHFQWTP